jgi:CheY-like chemotaxis protein
MAIAEQPPNQFAQVLTAIAQVLWPIFALILALKLLPELKSIFHRISEAKNLKIKWGDKELSVQEAAENIERALGSLLSAEASKKNSNLDAENLSSGSGSEPRAESQVNKRILWVDDKPKTVALEMAWLRDRGVQIDEAPTTEEALALFERDKYDLVITDMFRRELGVRSSHAGLDLLKELREADPNVNVIAYCAAASARAYGKQFLESGGKAVASDPVDLFSKVRQYVPVN